MGDDKLKFLKMLRPAMALIPEVQQAERKVAFRTRAIWTLIATLIYLVCSQIPLYGVYKQASSDPLYWLRVILASNRGTLMELGISPSVTAGMVLQLLAGSKLIDIDQNNKEEKALFNGVQKLLGLAIAFFEALAYVWSGMYGDLDKLGAGNAILIILQLTFSGVVVLLLDELIGNGYGVGNSGISLFIAINSCENIMWKTFSPITYPTEVGTEYEGSIVSLFHSLITRSDRIQALQQAFYRSHLPNLNNLIATVLIFFVVIYFQGFRVDLAVQSTKVKNAIQSYPIKLFYTSNTPIILQSALVSNLFFFSQILFKNFKSFFLIRLLGTWQDVEMGGGGHSIPVGGLVYYISPPRGLYDALIDPIHTIIYTVFVLASCALFSKTWIEVSGASVRDVAKQLSDQGMQIRGHRTDANNTSMKKELKRYIPVAATFGGMCVGALTIIADFLGVIGSGTGILLAVTIIYGYFESFKKEKEQGAELF